MSGQGPAGGDEISTKLLSVYGREPLLPDEREYKTWSANGTCFAYAIATWCFLTGGYAASLVGAVQGMVCLIAGNLIGVFLISASLSAGCQRYGVVGHDRLPRARVCGHKHPAAPLLQPKPSHDAPPARVPRRQPVPQRRP